VTGSRLACVACGWAPEASDPYPFRCANAVPGDDVDHVVVRTLGTAGLKWPHGAEPNPFVRYRTLLHSYHLAMAGGMADAEYVELVERLDAEVASVDAGSGFRVTPFRRSAGLSDRLAFDRGAGVWVKDETANVSGSHKGRHLFGLLLHLAVAERNGSGAERPELAIASCGNAALAAAVVAKAAGRPLRVFVPAWGDPVVLERLRELDAVVEVCPRDPDVPGDPTFHALRRAVAGGALPFTCQGSENGLVIEGGETIVYEIASDLLADGSPSLDRLFVQVGGGALASAVIAGFREARALGAIDRLPRFHAVQPRGGHPLKRAYDLVAERILDRIEAEDGEVPSGPEDEGDRALFIAERASSPAVLHELAYAAQHRSQFMWPWEDEPESMATGILDDETYDWLAVVRGMLETGGYPVVVDEETLGRANELGRVAARVDADATGTAGLAGLMEVLQHAEVGPGERVAVMFTGARRAVH
jgi:threonine synthase